MTTAGAFSKSHRFTQGQSTGRLTRLRASRRVLFGWQINAQIFKQWVDFFELLGGSQRDESWDKQLRIRWRIGPAD